MRSATLVPHLRSKTQISVISFEDRLLVQKVTFCCDAIKGLRHLFIKLETTSDLIALYRKTVKDQLFSGSLSRTNQ